MTIGKLAAITGPAATGKSTIARGLQSKYARDGEFWLVSELDLFGRGLSRQWIALGDHRGRQADRGFIYARGDDGSIALTLGPDGRRMLAAFHRSVAAVARSGVNVICETIVYDDADWNDWTEALDGIPACWVRLGAPPAVLEEREKADRTRVFQGLAQGMAARKPVGHYAIEADTSVETADAIIQRIATALSAER